MKTDKGESFMDTDMLIGRDFEAGTGTEETVLNPRTGETILNMPEANPDQIDRAVEVAGFRIVETGLYPPSTPSRFLVARKV